MSSIAETLKGNPVADLLALWIRYQHRPDMKIGWRGRSIILEGGDDDEDVNVSSQQLYDRLDMQVAEAVDTIIEYDMPHVAGCAIKYRCHIMSKWPFHTMIFADALAGAEEELEKRLRRNSLTSNYF